MSRWADYKFKRIPLSECIKGRVYEIESRNLSYGVFNGKDGFIGIREKFGYHYLFCEYHHEQGPPFGTVSPFRDTGIDVPADIPLVDHGPTLNQDNGREMVNDNSIENPNPSMKGQKGWWRYVDTGEPAPSVDAGCHAIGLPNDKLFRFMQEVERKEGGQQ